MTDQNQQLAPRSSNRNGFRNPPRFTTIIPVPANPTLYAQVVDVIGGAQKLPAFIKAFVKARFDATGWRTVKDITSRDTKHAASTPNTPATEMLDEPFQSLTAQLAAIVEDRSKGAIKLTREDTLSVLAVLRDDEAALTEAGIKLWNAVNENLNYVTLGCSALPPGQIPEAARVQAAKLEF